MVIAYHAIFTTYGTWLPNDPRGSYSRHIYREALRDLGPIRYTRQDPQPPRSELRVFWRAARRRLSRPPFFLDDTTRPVVAAGFAKAVARLHLAVRACAIMNDHVHAIVMRSRYRIEYVVNQPKADATRALGLTKTPWARKGRNVFLNDGGALRAAIAYVDANPVVAGMGPQRWEFVTPLPVEGAFEPPRQVGAAPFHPERNSHHPTTS